MNAVEFLLKEHEKVRQMLDEINDESHKPETKKKMFNTLCDDLLRHEAMEHKIWYPHFKANEKLDETVKHLISEEKHAEKAINQFDKVESNEEWEKLFLKFKQDVLHHAHEEETKLFPKIKKMFSEGELENIGHEMYSFKQQYLKENN
ncbi:MAG: hemerythrin domain-containing protein [Gammaproteobacteria bacterium]|nr:hemerythrin domain-containing protein [Gammaproteobacteria bacterium]